MIEMLGSLLVVSLVQLAACEEWTDLIDLPAGIENAGGTTPQGDHGYVYPDHTFMRSTFGTPCIGSVNCNPNVNSNVGDTLVTANVGPFRVTGNKYAVDSLKCALNRVKTEKPTLYNVLGTAGMLCCRWIRGSTTSYSNHAWGMAVDFKINGQLDPRGDRKAQRGLHALYPYMHAEGFYWAAGYSRSSEDAMHFEVAKQVAQQWASTPPSYPRCLTESDLSSSPAPAPSTSCQLPDGTQGMCKDVGACNGITTSGHCPGATNIQCCTNPSCQINDGTEGQCQTVASCSGRSTPGHCPGAANIQC
eukprot:Sspe_Gene.103352::Locus_79171_Transcript_1_1_Confidence_1.000_Length_960::g.103352::m.103352